MNFLKRSLLPVLLLSFVAGWMQTAQAASIAWRKDLKQAAAEAAKTGKPILVQFTAEWCGYCHKMLDETYSNSEVIRQVNESFIPLVLDADEHARLVEAIGVSAFPTTVIISPQLDVEGKIEGFHRAPSFTQRIEPFIKRPAARIEIAIAPPAKPEATLLNQPIRPATANLETAPPAGLDAAPPASEPAAAPSDRAKSGSTTATAETTPALNVEPAPVAFDGLCLVSLLNARQFKPGDMAIEYEYRNVTLRFVSAAARQEFIENPTKFWPLADGHCPVATVNLEQDTTGDVRTVAVFRGHLVIFHSLKHREEFATRPGDYLQRLEAIQQARR